MKGNQYLFISLHLRREYRLVKVDRVDLVTARLHDFPRELFVAQNARVPLATWAQVPILVILDIELIVRARNLDDVPLHSKRRGSSGKH
jgi:hypothetical protein